MGDAVATFINWVVQTPLSLFIQSHLWVIPTLQTIHILCVAIVFSAAAMLDFKLLGFISREQPLTTLVQRYLPAAWVCVVILAITGSLLIIAEPARSILAVPFQVKMLMLLAVIIITVVFQRVVATNAVRWETAATRSPAATFTAIASLALWIGIIVAGRWIAYAEVT